MTAAPARFVAFCDKVNHGLTDNANIPETLFALRQRYLEQTDLLKTSYHAALDCGRTAIRERDKIIQDTLVILDQLASSLEAAFVLNPDALFTTGFTITQERRSANRTRLPLVAPPDFNVTNSPERGRALGTASTFPGAFNHEIQINMKDPSIETDWFHKAMFPDSQNMQMENLESCNTFFRMRHHGPDGPGPWSAIVTTPIT